MTINQHDTPIITALKNYLEEGTLPFHIPGHKQGRGNKALSEFLGGDALKVDLACMEDLDNISNPIGVIQQAQHLAAQLYGAEHAYFLVNGTTCGIQAMIMGVCNPGDKLLVPRNAHKSAISGIIMSGAEPIYMEPEIDPFFGIAMGITVDTVAAALKRHPDAKAVFLINPTYYGVASDIKAIVDLVHAYQIPVLVDEAHGAHFPFSSRLPLSAIEAGADLAACSTHKLGGSLAQSSLLLHQGSRINPQKIKATLNLTQTTSPSYLLLASLDLARKQLALEGQEMIEHTLELALEAGRQIQDIQGLTLLTCENLASGSCMAYDPTKIVVNVRALGLSGYEVERILRKTYKIQIELSDLYNIIALVTLGDTPDTIARLVWALTELAAQRHHEQVEKYCFSVPAIPEARVSPREAFYAETHTLSLEDAEDEISAEMIMAYPPGIPIICPGELITREIIDYVSILRHEAAELQGTQDPEVKNIQVLNRRLFVVQQNRKPVTEAI